MTRYPFVLLLLLGCSETHLQAGESVRVMTKNSIHTCWYPEEGLERFCVNDSREKR